MLIVPIFTFVTNLFCASSKKAEQPQNNPEYLVKDGEGKPIFLTYAFKLDDDLKRTNLKSLVECGLVGAPAAITINDEPNTMFKYNFKPSEKSQKIPKYFNTDDEDHYISVTFLDNDDENAFKWGFSKTSVLKEVNDPSIITPINGERVYEVLSGNLEALAFTVTKSKTNTNEINIKKNNDNKIESISIGGSTGIDEKSNTEFQIGDQAVSVESVKALPKNIDFSNQKVNQILSEYKVNRENLITVINEKKQDSPFIPDQEYLLTLSSLFKVDIYTFKNVYGLVKSKFDNLVKSPKSLNDELYNSMIEDLDALMNVEKLIDSYDTDHLDDALKNEKTDDTSKLLLGYLKSFFKETTVGKKATVSDLKAELEQINNDLKITQHEDYLPEKAKIIESKLKFLDLYSDKLTIFDSAVSKVNGLLTELEKYENQIIEFRRKEVENIQNQKVLTEILAEKRILEDKLKNAEENIKKLGGKFDDNYNIIEENNEDEVDEEEGIPFFFNQNNYQPAQHFDEEEESEVELDENASKNKRSLIQPVFQQGSGSESTVLNEAYESNKKFYDSLKKIEKQVKTENIRNVIASIDNKNQVETPLLENITYEDATNGNIGPINVTLENVLPKNVVPKNVIEKKKYQKECNKYEIRKHSSFIVYLTINEYKKFCNSCINLVAPIEKPETNHHNELFINNLNISPENQIRKSKEPHGKWYLVSIDYKHCQNKRKCPSSKICSTEKGLDIIPLNRNEKSAEHEANLYSENNLYSSLVDMLRTLVYVKESEAPIGVYKEMLYPELLHALLYNYDHDFYKKIFASVFFENQRECIKKIKEKKENVYHHRGYEETFLQNIDRSFVGNKFCSEIAFGKYLYDKKYENIIKSICQKQNVIPCSGYKYVPCGAGYHGNWDNVCGKEIDVSEIEGSCLDLYTSSDETKSCDDTSAAASETDEETDEETDSSDEKEVKKSKKGMSKLSIGLCIAGGCTVLGVGAAVLYFFVF